MIGQAADDPLMSRTLRVLHLEHYYRAHQRAQRRALIAQEARP